MDIFKIKFQNKIKKAGSDENSEYGYSVKSRGNTQKDFHYKDIDESESVDSETGEQEDPNALKNKLKEAYENQIGKQVC